MGLSMSEDKIENSAVRSFFIADPITATKEISNFKNEYEDLEIDEKELKKAMEWERKIFSLEYLKYSQLTH